MVSYDLSSAQENNQSRSDCMAEWTERGNTGRLGTYR